ncbi:DUF7380 domain-containing protein [Aliiroseovarius sp. S253]|uniref:DUF7380 domain-containing protein n=1 Tax=Aliiroseovarius sp. S253 TaxID=3415133 RepID=UPI003C7DBAB8
MTKAAWQLAEAKHVNGIDIDGPISSLVSPRTRTYADAFFKTAEKLPGDHDHRHIYMMLGSLMQMYQKSGEPGQPYGAMMRMENRRTAEPADFVGSPVEAMVACSEATKNSVVLARICDVAWLLERKRHEIGMRALRAYIDVAKELESGKLVEDHGNGLVGLSGFDTLRRALFVSRGIGRPETEHEVIIELVKNCRIRSAAQPGQNFFRRFSELDLDWGASDPFAVGDLIVDVLKGDRTGIEGNIDAELWILASRAYRMAKNDEKKLECQANAAESYVRAADQFDGKPGGAMLASHWLSMAISQYHGHPGSRERRKALRHRLVDVQEGIREELQTISTPMDFREIAEETKKRLDGMPLLDLLLLFADLDRSPDPEQLVEKAQKSAEEAPLSSLISASYMDRDGKTVAKAPGVDPVGESDIVALLPTIHRSESIRRQILARSTIEVARSSIMQQHFVSLDHVADLLAHSPAVPPDLHTTISTGFLRFFEADHISALHILTPMLEGILRHILKSAGHDVSTFDNATGTQENRTISSLFDAMREELDQVFGRALTDDIERVFLSKYGPSIRHSVAHSLHHDGVPCSADAIYANWLIWRICCIPLFPHRDKIVLP